MNLNCSLNYSEYVHISYARHVLAVICGVSGGITLTCVCVCVCVCVFVCVCLCVCVCMRPFISTYIQFAKVM